VNSSSVLEAAEVQKVYGGGTRALDGLSLSVQRGEIYGLLGANGAGKTTFVRIAATQLLPSAGTISVLGFDVVASPRQVRQNIAVVPQEGRPLLLNTPYEHVLTYLIARGMNFSTARRRADETLAELHLDGYRNTICGNLSGGLRQRVLIAMAVSSDAELLILDEPTIGLDPVARVDVWNLVREYADKGRTIILTTHYMDEAEFLSDRLLIMKKGRSVASGTPAEIKSRLGATHAVVVKSLDANLGLEAYGSVMRAGSTVRVLTDRRGADEISSRCLAKGVEFSVRSISVEDVFIREVGAIEGSEAA
jgi:ABC-2 type transport system ATP-binding protein